MNWRHWIVLGIVEVCLRFWELGNKISKPLDTLLVRLWRKFRPLPMPSKFELAERYAGLAGHQNYDWFEDFNIGDALKGILEVAIALMLFSVLVGGEQDKAEAYLALAQGDWENIIESEGVE